MKNTPYSVGDWKKKATVVLALTVGFAASISGVHAGQTNSLFDVSVTLKTKASPIASDFCRITDDPRAYGAIVTVVCSTGAVVAISPGRQGQPVAPMHGGVYQFVIQGWSPGDRPDFADDYNHAVGTTTSWRVLHLANREYLEMTIAW